MCKKEDLIDKRILVALTYLHESGQIKEHKQLHGLIKEMSGSALSIERADGKGTFTIPFNGELDKSDENEVYTLKSTGEEVTGVSYLAGFTLRPAQA